MNDQSAPAPPPGIYRDTPAWEYHAWPYCSQSRLKLLAKSPATARASMERPKDPTPQMKKGTALHCAVLEPNKFRDTYAQPEQCSALTGKGERCRNAGAMRQAGRWFCRTKGHAPDGTFDALQACPDYADVIGMHDALSAHPATREMLLRRTDTEISIVWDDAETGVRCKLRADFLIAPWQTIGDIKTCADASEEGFAKAIWDYRYHQQAAFYLDGTRSAGLNYERFAFACVEPEYPYLTAARAITEAVVDIGRQRNRQLLRLWARCERSGKWPGFSDEFTDVDFPAWVWKKALDEITAADEREEAEMP